MSQMPRCAVRYMGKTYPQYRGARCEKDHPHDGTRHSSIQEGYPLTWWTEGEKEGIRERKKLWPQSGANKDIKEEDVR